MTTPTCLFEHRPAVKRAVFPSDFAVDGVRAGDAFRLVPLFAALQLTLEVHAGATELLYGCPTFLENYAPDGECWDNRCACARDFVVRREHGSPVRAAVSYGDVIIQTKSVA